MTNCVVRPVSDADGSRVKGSARLLVAAKVGNACHDVHTDVTTERVAKTRVRVTDRRRKVAALCLRRVDQADIGRQLGVDQATISRDVTALRAEWRAVAASDIAELLARELAELDDMERECAVEFEKSRGRVWIMTRLAIKDRRAAMLGLDPRAVAAQVNVQQVNNPYASLSDEELDAKITLVLKLDEVAQRRAAHDLTLDTKAQAVEPETPEPPAAPRTARVATEPRPSTIASGFTAQDRAWPPRDTRIFKDDDGYPTR